MSEPADSAPTARCPRCRQPTRLSTDNPWRPFCSERCRLIDFGGWLTGANAIPGEEVADADQAAETGPDGSLH